MNKIIRAGKISTFGGPGDHGISRTEGLALIEQSDLADPWFSELFLETADKGLGLARRLDPAMYYIAARWNYLRTPRSLLRKSLCAVRANGKEALARPVDWGPSARTGRVMDLSPGLAEFLGLKTDDEAEFELITTDRLPINHIAKCPLCGRGSECGDC